MPEKIYIRLIQEFIKASTTGDVNQMLSLFSEDGVWIDPVGTYKGKESIKSHFAAGAKNLKDVEATEAGNGIIVQGDKAFLECLTNSTSEGKRVKLPAMCAFEFNGDRIKEMRTVYDRLLIGQQVAPWFAKPLINMIVKQSEKAMK